MQRQSIRSTARDRVITHFVLRGVRYVTAMAMAAAPGCSDSQGPGNSEPLPSSLRAQPVVNGLSNPVFLTAPTGDSRLFVVEQPGRIRIVKNGSLVTTPFLSISAKLLSGGERGLLGLAFHPHYATNGFFFVYYTDLNGDITVERYKVSSNADVADAASATPVISIAHRSASNHNGGMLLFGEDGMLYMGTGDGGGGGDPSGNAQNRSQLLGKLLRLDVDAASPYGIPSSNPYVGQAGTRGEIWAYGLRNPWRYAFDRTTHQLYIADVGQGAWEEVNVVASTRGGVNYGWNQTEGNHCYTSGCNLSLYEPAMVEYNHSDGCSITGGFVYRGNAIPGLKGHYFYSDYCSGWVRSFRFANGMAEDKKEWDLGSLGQILSYGEDATGELYILSANGTVYKLMADS